MVVARPAVMVVARAKDSAVTTEGYRGNGGGGDEDDSKSNSSKIGERSGNSGGGASHLCLFFVGLTTKSRGLFFCSKLSRDDTNHSTPVTRELAYFVQ